MDPICYKLSEVEFDGKNLENPLLNVDWLTKGLKEFGVFSCLLLGFLYIDKSNGSNGFFRISLSYWSIYPLRLRFSNYFRATKIALLSFLSYSYE